MKDLAGKTAFVTGAASGIGLGITTALAQAGVKVMLCDIEQAALQRAVADLKRTNADVDSVKADVSLKGELRSAADATIARYGKVHILVNYAGVGGGRGYGFCLAERLPSRSPNRRVTRKAEVSDVRKNRKSPDC
jgi:NAD(P)-dependent dehydrogenase (short-subunit alcohol dehydrogenase family)